MLYLILFATRLINLAGGVVCLLIIAASYSSVEAGRIYTVLSLVGAATLFELGLSTLVLQRASQLTRDQRWDSLEPVNNRDLITPTFGHYLVLIGVQACLLLVVLLPIGLWVILGIFKEPLGGTGVWAWVIACVVMALGLPTALLLNTLEGLGQLAVVAKVRAVQSAASFLGISLSLLCGVGYPSVTIQLTCSLIAGWVAIWVVHARFVKMLIRKAQMRLLPGRIALDWPLQWRLSLSFLSGYFSNQAWVVAITLTGAVALAGHVAMTLQVLTAAVGFALTPIAARLPTLSALAHRAGRQEYLLLAARLSRHAALIFGIVTVMVLGGYFLSKLFMPGLQSKMLPSGPLIFIVASAPLVLCLAATTIFNQSLGRDDLYVVSLFRIAAPIALLMFIGRDLGAWSFSLSFTCIVLLSTLMGLAIHRRSLTRILS